jgi:hypothetical protein
VRTCYGEKQMQRLAAQPIVCSGTILGTSKAWAVLRDHFASRPRRTDCWADQGILNFVRHSHSLNAAVRVVVQPLWEGIVCTTSSITPLDEAKRHYVDGVLRRNDGAACPVVHQYDRFDFITAPFATSAGAAKQAWRPPPTGL